MFKTLINIFRIPELRNKVLFTLFMLAIYRIGYHVPLPGVNQTGFSEIAKRQAEAARAGGGEESAAARLASYVSLFSGGNLSKSRIFGLGIMPYISASIIFQLLTTVLPALEKLQREGEPGRRKIQEWTRYTTVPLCVVQAMFWLTYMQNSDPPLVLTGPNGFSGHISFWLMGIFGLTAGCVFLMWLGEQIDEYGLGNGISLVILPRTLARLPNAVQTFYSESKIDSASGNSTAVFGKVVFLVLSFVFIVAGSILITQAQRRIPVQQAKHNRGLRVYA